MFRSIFMCIQGWHFQPRISQSGLQLKSALRSRLCLYMLNAKISAAGRTVQDFQTWNPAHLFFSLLDIHTAPSLWPHNLNRRTSLSSRHPPRLEPPSSPTCCHDTNQPCVTCQISPAPSPCLAEALGEASAFPPGVRLLMSGSRSSGFAGQRCYCPWQSETELLLVVVESATAPGVSITRPDPAEHQLVRIKRLVRNGLSPNYFLSDRTRFPNSQGLCLTMGCFFVFFLPCHCNLKEILSLLCLKILLNQFIHQWTQ